MVERRKELTRRYHRKAKIRKLKAKLAGTKDSVKKEQIVKKIKQLSPWWTAPKPAAAGAKAH
jgi:hypothetical protein